MAIETVTSPKAAPAVGAAARLRVRPYAQLTKPSIMLLVLFTGMTALVVEGSLITQPLRFLLVLLGLFLCGGSANALNQYFEREIDARMARTRRRRPLPLGQVSPAAALAFAVTIGLAGVAMFALVFNLLTAALALGTILFYSLFYTLYLKPLTPQNIVIGGIAGAMAPVGAWAAATGTVGWEPWLMTAIVFFWTPPHFWSLALFCNDDYRNVDLPMLPVVKGTRTTLRVIIGYTVIVVTVSLLLAAFDRGILYTAAAGVLGGLFLFRAIAAYLRPSDRAYRSLFGFSIVYLFALFAAMMVDKAGYLIAF